MKKKATIVIVDYGLGNLYSLSKALQLYAHKVVITNDHKIIASADGMILPGVGSFASGMRGIEEKKLTKPIHDFSRSGKPMLGICLGAQLMLSKGFEFGEHSGLDLFSGKVEIFPKSVAKKEKIPNIGWLEIYPPKKTDWNKTIMEEIPNKTHVYFVHSYIMIPDDPKDILVEAEYGGLSFCSAIKKGNIYGTQFHPEKSGEVGLKIIKNFVSIANNYE